MSINLQKTKEYFLDLIPDNSVFNMLGQKLYTGKSVHDVPYYWYDSDPDVTNSLSPKSAENTLYRGYFRIEHDSNLLSLSDIFEDYDDEMQEYITIIDAQYNRFTGTYYTYVAYWNRYNVPNFNTTNFISILGVGF